MPKNQPYYDRIEALSDQICDEFSGLYEIYEEAERDGNDEAFAYLHRRYDQLELRLERLRHIGAKLFAESNDAGLSPHF